MIGLKWGLLANLNLFNEDLKGEGPRIFKPAKKSTNNFVKHGAKSIERQESSRLEIRGESSVHFHCLE